jgi:hypothetical protein
MALAQTDLPELRRFTFFVSRRFEEGRERFRLHMGYFATLAEAEEWLGLVREIYPGAWAGETPGRKLRERAAAAAAAQAQHAAGPQAQVRPPTARAGVTAPAPRPAARPVVTAPAPARVPVVHAAPPVLSPPSMQPRQAPVPARMAGAATAPRVGVPAARVAPKVTSPAKGAPAASAIPAAPRTPAAPSQQSLPAQQSVPAAAGRSAATPASPGRKPPVVTPPATAPAATSAAKAGVKPVFEDSNVREVLKALGDAAATGETRLMRTPPLPREPAAPSAPPLSDTQVLKMLETRRSGERNPGTAEVDDSNIPMLKPDDTGTRQALKEAIVSNASVAFAVQLQWSVQPVELDKVPPLAIFSAYTLYTVEGSRDGRKWYGLRLGFFSDAISAKQVAYYVRSEFASVAVVPVSPQEKSRATEQDAAAALAAPVPTRVDPMDEFKLIEDEAPRPPTPPAASAPPSRLAAAAAAQLPPRVPPGRPVGQRAIPGRPRVPNPRVAPRETRGPQTLEETLEILGASQLTIDTGRGETLNDSGVRHLRVEVQKNSPFSKLLERLSERLKKS